MEIARAAVKIPYLACAWPAYHLAHQLVERIGVISPSKYIEPILIQRAKQSGCWDKVVAFRSPTKAQIKVLEPPVYTPQEYEAECTRIAKEQVEQNGAQLIFCSCSYNNIAFPPGARERMEKALGGDIIVITDPMKIALLTLEMMVKCKLSHSKLEYPQMAIGDIDPY